MPMFSTNNSARGFFDTAGKDESVGIYFINQIFEFSHFQSCYHREDNIAVGTAVKSAWDKSPLPFINRNCPTQLID